jgi:tape measure domain-containing protein
MLNPQQSGTAQVGSTADVNRVFLAFTEMLSKGEVQSTQLRKQLGTDLPGAVQLFADALGVSTEKLDGLMKRGEISRTARRLSSRSALAG